MILERDFFMKVSIIIPVYKVEPYIVRCVNSVLRQTYRQLEVVFVDDCSPDNSMKLVNETISKIQCKDIEFKFIRHDHNRGLSAARNTGMDAATGEYIYFLDSDDEITADCISILAEPLKNYHYDFVTGFYDVKGSNMSFPQQTVRGKLIGSERIAKAYLNNQWHCMAWNKLCCRSYLIEYNLYFQEGLIHEDELWSALMAITANSIFVVPQPTYIYYIRPNSIITAEKEDDRLLHYQRILKSFYEYIEKKGTVTSCVDIVGSRLKQAVIGQMKRQQYSSHVIYKILRECGPQSFKFKNMVYMSAKERIVNLDQYLPVVFGYIYKSIMSNMLHLKSKFAKHSTVL